MIQSIAKTKPPSIPKAKGVGVANFIIYDVNGRPVKQWQAGLGEGSNMITVSVGNLPGGIYHLAATTGDSKTVTRFIKIP